MGFFTTNKDTQLLERTAAKLEASNAEIDLSGLKEAFESSSHDEKKESIDATLFEIRTALQSLQFVGVTPREALQLLTK